MLAYFFHIKISTFSPPKGRGSGIGVGDGGQGLRGARALPKIREKFFSDNFYVKFGHFSGKNHVNLGNFVTFLGKYHKNLGILIPFGARIV